MTGKRVLAAAPALGVLMLAACGTMPMTMTAAPQETLSGAYLAGNFAAAEGDVKAASDFYAATLKDDPSNQDVLSRTLLFAAEYGDSAGAIALSDRILAANPQDLFAHLVREAGALQKKDYDAVLKDMEGPSQGAFAVLTNSIVGSWALAGQHDFDGASDQFGRAFAATRRGRPQAFAEGAHPRLCRPHAGHRGRLS